MKVRFSDTRINEYHNGGFHAVNNGEPIEVPNLMAEDILASTHQLDGESVPVFVRVENGVDEKPGEDADVDLIDPQKYADKYSRKELAEIAQGLGLDGNVYTNKLELASAILNSKGE